MASQKAHEALFLSKNGPRERHRATAILGIGGCSLSLALLETLDRSCNSCGTISYVSASEIPSDYWHHELSPTAADGSFARLRQKALYARRLCEAEGIAGRGISPRRVVIVAFLDGVSDWEDAVCFAEAVRPNAVSLGFCSALVRSQTIPFWALSRLRRALSFRPRFVHLNASEFPASGDDWCEMSGKLAYEADRAIQSGKV